MVTGRGPVFGPKLILTVFVLNTAAGVWGLVMAQMWIQEADETGWMARPLTGDAYVVSEQGFSLREDGAGGRANVVARALVVRCDNGSQEHWLLLSQKRACVQVNSWPLVLGVRLLRDRDEILARANRSTTAFQCFFSTERLAQVVAYPGGNGAVRCPRCKQPLEQSQMAVKCPNASCSAWHHQEQQLPCWTYSDHCALCDQRTELDAGFRWTPEEL